jgi:GDP-L-fucose synthase
MVAAVIDKFYKAKNQKLDSVEIWGEGNARREFMYSSDLADCIWECVKNFQNMPDIMNVGMGKDYSIKEYYNLIKEIVGYNGNITNDLSKPVGMKQKLVDITQLENFGWKSKVSLYEGLSKTYDFYKKNII